MKALGEAEVQLHS